jgi:hypothetical protein
MADGFTKGARNNCSKSEPQGHSLSAQTFSNQLQAIQSAHASHRLFQHSEGALARLLVAHKYANELNRSLWDFAVEIEVLKQFGVTGVELRWLVCRGFVEHAREVSSATAASRQFEMKGKNNLTFFKRTGFVLTEQGAALVRSLIRTRDLNGHGRLSAVNEPLRQPDENRGKANPLVPCWDRNRLELRWEDVIVKQFKVPAPNQELILTVFQELGWPTQIDDPLPPHPEHDPKRRLHDTINSLNRSRKNALIHFSGNGKGQAIRWESVPPSHSVGMTDV